MSREAVHAFLAGLREDAALRAKLAELAARHGFELSDDELAEPDLDALSGGIVLPGLSPSVEGLDRLRPRNPLDLTGTGDRFSGEAYVDGTTHSLGDGYTTKSDSDGG